jgi:hypothetical protein
MAVPARLDVGRRAFARCEHPIVKIGLFADDRRSGRSLTVAARQHAGLVYRCLPVDTVALISQGSPTLQFLLQVRQAALQIGKLAAHFRQARQVGELLQVLLQRPRGRSPHGLPGAHNF